MSELTMSAWAVVALSVGAVLALVVVGVAVFLWQRQVAAKECARLDQLRADADQGRITAEREKSNVEVALRAKCDELERLRQDDAADLERQAKQFHDEIQALNARLAASEQMARGEREQRAQVTSRLVAAEESLKTNEKLLADRESQHQKSLAERDAQYERTLAQGKEQFKALAQQILEDREKKLVENGTNPLSALVTQLKQDINNLKTSISDSNEKSASSQTALTERIKALVDQTNKVTEQANNLAGAIRGDAQLTGEWGEIQLKRVLDLSGMTEGTDYTYQETFGDETGRKTKRTDYVVKMPGNRALIIDSKNTIAAAERFHAAADDNARTAAAEEIIASVRGHVDEIIRADYQAAVPNALPTVLMYIPLEEVYMLAMKATISVGGQKELLRDWARRNNVIFVNSASVVPVARLIEMMWNAQQWETNREKIIGAAREVLNRANDFVKEFLAVGDVFTDALKKYDAAKVRLVDAPRGQSIAKAVSNLVRLGVPKETRGGREVTLAEPIEQALLEPES